MHLLESGDKIDGRWPADNERGVARLSGRSFSHFVDASGQPKLRDAHLILKLKVTARARLGDQQQVVEEKQVAVAALQTLKIHSNNNKSHPIKKKSFFFSLFSPSSSPSLLVF